MTSLISISTGLLVRDLKEVLEGQNFIELLYCCMPVLQKELRWSQFPLRLRLKSPKHALTSLL